MPHTVETLIQYIQTGGMSLISIKIIRIAVAAMRKPPKCNGCQRCFIDKFILHEGQMLGSMVEDDFKEKQHCLQCFGFLAGHRKRDYRMYYTPSVTPIFIPPVVVRAADHVHTAPHPPLPHHTPANAHPVVGFLDRMQAA